MSAITTGKLLLGVAGVAVLAVVIAAVTLEPPHVQRQQRLDARRTSDLSTANRAVNEYWKRRRALPPSLDAIAAEAGMNIQRKDPETDIAYGYEITGERSFRLCANFARDSEAGGGHPTEFEWAHGSGRQCFDRIVENKAQ
jgi:hypothetical protein